MFEEKWWNRKVNTSRIHFCMVICSEIFVYLRKYIHLANCYLAWGLHGTMFVKANVIEFLDRIKSISTFSCLINELIWQDLNNLNTLCRSISKDSPFKKVLFWMKLNCIKWIILGLYNSNKFFIVWCFRIGDHIPERF